MELSRDVFGKTFWNAETGQLQAEMKREIRRLSIPVWDNYIEQLVRYYQDLWDQDIDQEEVEAFKIWKRYGGKTYGEALENRIWEKMADYIRYYMMEHCIGYRMRRKGLGIVTAIYSAGRGSDPESIKWLWDKITDFTRQQYDNKSTIDLEWLRQHPLPDRFMHMIKQWWVTFWCSRENVIRLLEEKRELFDVLVQESIDRWKKRKDASIWALDKIIKKRMKYEAWLVSEEKEKKRKAEMKLERIYEQERRTRKLLEREEEKVRMKEELAKMKKEALEALNIKIERIKDFKRAMTIEDLEETIMTAYKVLVEDRRRIEEAKKSKKQLKKKFEKKKKKDEWVEEEEKDEDSKEGEYDDSGLEIINTRIRKRRDPTNTF